MAIKPEDVLGSMKKASGAAAQMASDLLERSKLGLEIASKENELSDLFKELGHAVYEAKKHNMQGMTPEALIAIIDSKVAEIEELKAKRAEKSDPVCPGCGKPIEENFDFCPRCGTKIVKPGCGCGCKDDEDCGCDDCKDEPK